MAIRRRRILYGAAFALAVGSGAQAQDFSYGDMRQFLAAAGFPVVANHTTNRCGQAIRPTILPLDMNGDGRKNEAILIDKGACYPNDGAFFSLLARTTETAPWRLLYSHEGELLPEPTRTGGWRDVAFTSSGHKTALHYNGNSYVSADGEGSALAIATKGPAAPQVAAGPYPSDGWKLPMKVAALPPTQTAAIMKQVGGSRTRNGKWARGGEGCNTLTIDDPIKDINGDGHADPIVIGETDACGGIPGGEYVLLTGVPGGWKMVTQGLGYPSFAGHRGPGGWPDMIEGGPRICNPLSRWNGKDYIMIGYSDGEKSCTPG